jgi:hypothetical protein
MKTAAWMLGTLLVVDALYLLYAVATADMYEGLQALPYALAVGVPVFLVFLAVLTVHVSRARPPSRRS